MPELCWQNIEKGLKRFREVEILNRFITWGQGLSSWPCSQESVLPSLLWYGTPMRGPTCLRGSMLVLLCRPGLTFWDLTMELGSQVSVRMIGFWNGRGWVVALTIRGKVDTIAIISNEAQLIASVSGPAVMLIEPGIPRDSTDEQPAKVLLHCVTWKKKSQGWCQGPQWKSHDHLVFRCESALRPVSHGLRGRLDLLEDKFCNIPENIDRHSPSFSSRELQVLIRLVVHQGEDDNIQTFRGLLSTGCDLMIISDNW